MNKSMQFAELTGSTMTPAASPFDLDQHDAYARWCDRKLASRPLRIADLMVEIRDPLRLSEWERAALVDRCSCANMAVYAAPLSGASEKDTVRAVALQLGLRRLDHNLCAEADGIAVIQLAHHNRPQEYIPYTNRALNWHTDGYYNRLSDPVKGIIMHCVVPAETGGDNLLIDPELVYLQLRDEDPDHLAALMRPDTMTIPANVENGRVLRPERSGPVFSVEPGTGALHMRYTARQRHVRWRSDAATRAARTALQALLIETSPYAYRLRLQPGQGIVCNNVLHAREAFHDSPHAATQRTLLRARYLERVATF